MRPLSRYHNTTVKITCTNGDTFTGPCEWNSADYGLAELGFDEESLQIGDTVLFAGEIQSVEILRPEVVIPVRDWPEAKEEIAAWFHARWGIPLETYRASIRACLAEASPVPQWYVVVRGHKIIAGCGVVENDFHVPKGVGKKQMQILAQDFPSSPRRKIEGDVVHRRDLPTQESAERTSQKKQLFLDNAEDLSPNVCAVYVDEPFRRQGVARFLLQTVCADMASLGIPTLYLLTDHAGFYERCGWSFHSLVPTSSAPSRLYVHHS